MEKKKEKLRKKERERKHTIDKRHLYMHTSPLFIKKRGRDLSQKQTQHISISVYRSAFDNKAAHLEQGTTRHGQHAVRVDDRVQPMGNRDDGTVRKGLAQRFLDKVVSVLVQTGRGFIQHEHRAVAQKGARKAQQLAAKYKTQRVRSTFE